MWVDRDRRKNGGTLAFRSEKPARFRFENQFGFLSGWRGARRRKLQKQFLVENENERKNPADRRKGRAQQGIVFDESEPKMR